MVVHLAFSATVLVARTGCHQGPILLGVQLRQLVQEGNHAPDVLITHTLAPSRHAAGFDTVLDDPESGGWVSINTYLGEVWWRRIKRLAELGFGHTRRQVAPNAHGVVVARTSTDKRLIVQFGYFDALGAHFDGAITRHREECMHGRKVGVVGTDIDQANIGSSQHRSATDSTRCH